MVKIVRESVEFKRGIEPKEALGIGTVIKKPTMQNLVDLTKGIYVMKIQQGDKISYMAFEKYPDGEDNPRTIHVGKHWMDTEEGAISDFEQAGGANRWFSGVYNFEGWIIHWIKKID